MRYLPEKLDSSMSLLVDEESILSGTNVRVLARVSYIYTFVDATLILASTWSQHDVPKCNL